MGIFDRIAGLFSETAKARGELASLQARVAREVNRELSLRGYDAARATRSTWAWLAGSTSANAEIYLALLTLRNRSRDLVRNNPHASKALRVLVNNTIGDGIVAQARTGDKALDSKINDAWERFVETADFGGQLDFYGLQRLATRSMLEGGETLIRLRTADDAGPREVPLRLQLLEGDYLDHRKNESAGTGRGKISQGVEFDGDGRRIGYWLFREHPGEQPFVVPQSYVSDRFAARDVLHLYELQRIGQIRGVPWFTPGMLKARDLDTYDEAERVRKRIEACVAAMVIGADDESQEAIAPMVTDASGQKVEQFEPGLIAIVRGSKEVRFTQPAQNGAFHEYKRAGVQDLAAAWDMTYELLSGDLSRVNYSSIQAGVNEFRRSVHVLQWLTLAPMFLRPVWRAFIDKGVAAGTFPANAPYGHEFTTPAFQPIDKVKETAGDVDAVRAFLDTPQEAIRRRGGDPDDVLTEWKAWHDKLVSFGLISDADPGLAPKAGAASTAAEEEPGATGDK